MEAHDSGEPVEERSGGGVLGEDGGGVAGLGGDAGGLALVMGAAAIGSISIRGARGGVDEVVVGDMVG